MSRIECVPLRFIPALGHSKFLVHELPASKDKVYGDYFRFLLGIRDVSAGFDTTWHGRNTNSLQRVAVFNKIEKLWRKGGELLFYGTFKNDVGITISVTNVLAKSFMSNKGIAIPVWNTTSQPRSIELLVDTDLLIEQSEKVKEVSSLESAKSIHYKTIGKKTSLTLQLMPNDVEVVILRFSTS